MEEILTPLETSGIFKTLKKSYLLRDIRDIYKVSYRYGGLSNSCITLVQERV
jgi:hypothetical protein